MERKKLTYGENIVLQLSCLCLYMANFYLYLSVCMKTGK